MTPDDFRHLLQRYREGKCTPEELVRIETWFGHILDEDLELTEWEKGQVRRRIKDNLVARVRGHRSGRRFLSQWAWPAAAAILLMIAAGVFSFLGGKELFSDPAIAGYLGTEAPITRIVNNSNAVERLDLPDGSTVDLHPASLVYYSDGNDSSWGKETREIHLVGEAFFDVVPDARRPFYVYGGSVVTKVLGTSFTIKALEAADRIEVAVKTGKVSVYEEGSEMSGDNLLSGSGVVLTPNERVQYFVKDRHWVTSLVDKPQLLPSSDLDDSEFLLFNGTPVREVFAHIKSAYDIDIILENEVSWSCTFTGNVTEMELFDMLKVICKSIGAAYEVKGTKILISGLGCG